MIHIYVCLISHISKLTTRTDFKMTTECFFIFYLKILISRISFSFYCFKQTNEIHNHNLNPEKCKKYIYFINKTALNILQFHLPLNYLWCNMQNKVCINEVWLNIHSLGISGFICQCFSKILSIKILYIKAKGKRCPEVIAEACTVPSEPVGLTHEQYSYIFKYQDRPGEEIRHNNGPEERTMIY